MSDPKLCSEIDGLLSAILQRRTGARPNTISTEMSGNVVKCSIEPGDPAAADPADSSSYRREASQAVTRATRRKVMAFIADRDPKTGIDTQKFLLERVQIKY